MSVTIITNNHVRPWILWDELTDAEKKENEWAGAYPDSRFLRYKGETYSEDQFTYCDSEVWRNWEGIHPDTFFSGILVRYTEDYDEVIVGRFYC